MSFYIGQKVVKITRPPNVRHSNGHPDLPTIPEGTVVTIRDIDHRGMGFGHEVPTLRFEEIIGPTEPSRAGLWEPGYDPRCYRPLDERKTDISVFTKILDDVRHRAPANVE